MAGIYIPGMKIPNGAAIFGIRPDGTVEDVMGCFVGKAITIPDHGNLKDVDFARDAIINKWLDCADNSFEYKRGLEDACEVIRNIPTIIPTERKEQ